MQHRCPATYLYSDDNNLSRLQSEPWSSSYLCLKNKQSNNLCLVLVWIMNKTVLTSHTEYLYKDSVSISFLEMEYQLISLQGEMHIYSVNICTSNSKLVCRVRYIYNWFPYVYCSCGCLVVWLYGSDCVLEKKLSVDKSVSMKLDVFLYKQYGTSMAGPRVCTASNPQ